MGKLVYFTYLFVVGTLNVLIWLTPYLASADHQLAPSLYAGFSYICHQLTSRSLCLFEDGIRSCTPQEGIKDLSYSKENVVIRDGKIGHRFPVCARDTAIYLTMFLGGLIYPIFFKLENKKIPNLMFFIFAIAPLGVDGAGQLLGFWESTNLIRIITGALAGAAIPFYFFPIVNYLRR